MFVYVCCGIRGVVMVCMARKDFTVPTLRHSRRMHDALVRCVQLVRPPLQHAGFGGLGHEWCCLCWRFFTASYARMATDPLGALSVCCVGTG